MNSINIAGNITADAETRFLPYGRAVVNFSVADNRGKDKTPIFWRCTWFGERAQKVSGYLLKGGSVSVVGALQEEDWTDKDGHQRKTMKVIVNDVALQGGKPQGQTSEPRQAAPRQAQAPRSAEPQRQAAQPSSGFEDMDDDLPF